MSRYPFKNVFLTGATGFVGSHLVPLLLKRGCDLTVLIRPKSPLESLKPYRDRIVFTHSESTDWETLFSEKQIDVIIHTACAGRFGGPPEEMIAANVNLGKKLLDAACDTGVRYFIHTDTALPEGLSFHTLTKKQFRRELENSKTNLIACNLLLHLIYGRGGRGFINTLVDKMLGDDISTIPLTAGTQIRDVIHISDLISAFDFLMAKLPTENGFWEYEIGSGTARPVREIVETVFREINNPAIKLDFGVVPMRPEEPLNLVANVSHLHALGWRAQMELATGVSEIINASLNLKKAA